MMAQPSSALEIHRLRKTFGDQVVLDNIDLSVPAGTVFCLLGPNGAGKTTLVRTLATLTQPDAGTIRIFGHDLLGEPDIVRRLIGVTGQYSAVDKVLTGAENLRLMGRLLHQSRLETRTRSTELLKRFDLVDAADRPTANYSGGMSRRLDLAMSLMGRPQMIFLDEPTTGLDPNGRRELWQVIRELVNDGVTIFLTTQYLEEADQLANRIAVLNHGRIVAEGTPAELKQLTPGGHIRLRFTDRPGLEAAARSTAHTELDLGELTMQVPSDGSVGALKRLLDGIADPEVSLAELDVHTPDLDDVFFALTGHPTAPTN